MRIILRRAAQSRLLLAILLVTALTASIDARRTLPFQVTPDNGFPMRPGTYWIYRGTVKWTETFRPLVPGSRRETRLSDPTVTLGRRQRSADTAF